MIYATAAYSIITVEKLEKFLKNGENMRK